MKNERNIRSTELAKMLGIGTMLGAQKTVERWIESAPTEICVERRTRRAFIWLGVRRHLRLDKATAEEIVKWNHSQRKRH